MVMEYTIYDTLNSLHTYNNKILDDSKLIIRHMIQYTHNKYTGDYTLSCCHGDKSDNSRHYINQLKCVTVEGAGLVVTLHLTYQQ